MKKLKGIFSDKVKGKIGLEIHAYIITKEKLFCRCEASREKGLKENTLVCPICTGQPGAKPMAPNESAVSKAVQIGLMLGCKINNVMKWQRKHYDWADMPKGYQNTLSGAGAVPVGVRGKFQGINIWSMHLEEDPASWNPETGCVDYNRSGLPLVEIVTAPDFSTSKEVAEWLKKLIHNLSYLKAVDSNAGVKVDVNVNLAGEKKTERVEIKNVSSIEDIARAVDYEIERQGAEGSVKETRRFDEKKGVTIRMRGKEEAQDYRFISDPDLQEIVIDGEFVSLIRRELPESPEEKLKKLVRSFKIGKIDALVLAKNIDIADFFEKVAEKIEPKFALHWVTGPLLRLLNDNGAMLDKINIRTEHFIALLKLVKDKKISELQAKQILKKFYPRSFAPEDIEGKIRDVKKIEKIAKETIKNNAKAVSDYKSGDRKTLNFLIGEVMRATDKRADFKIVREVLKKLLK